ncbi:MAG: TIGR00730 family Rossman fold protein [Chloroflexaceae bacterium]
MQHVCVFCGSSPGNRPVYLDAAHQTGMALVQRGIGLVYGGAQLGLMGRIADTVIEQGGNVIGVMPEHLSIKEVLHPKLPDLRIVDSMHTRKALMADLSDAFIALPGGLGTLEELCEILTWGQLGLHRKPCGLLNVAGFFDPLLALFDHAVAEGFLRPAHRSLVLVAVTPEELLDTLASYEAPPLPKWIERRDI